MSVMNETIASQLAHRTIRAYKDQAVPDEVMDVLFEVARQAPTTSFYQQVSIVHVKDQAVRDVVAAASGQPYVGGSAGELLVWVADAHRNAVIREEAGADVAPLESGYTMLAAMQDTMIAAQNLVVAAESLGLGTVYLGSIGGNRPAVIEALKLPKHTFPVVGMLVGYPDQKPAKKPRLPREVTVGVDAYPVVENYHDALAAYDEEVHTYYDMRDTSKPVARFTDQIAKNLGAGGIEVKPLIQQLNDQGLALHD